MHRRRDDQVLRQTKHPLHRRRGMNLGNGPGDGADTSILVYIKWPGGDFAPGDYARTGRYYLANITTVIQNLDRGIFEGIPAARDERDE